MTTVKGAPAKSPHTQVPVSSSPSKYTIEVVAKAAEVLNYVSQFESVPLTQVAQDLNLDKTRVYRILSTLEEVDYVDRDLRTKEYAVGYAFSRLGRFVPDDKDISHVCRGPIRELSLNLRQSISLGVLQGNQIKYIARHKHKRLLSLDIGVGTVLPAHATSMGKMLLSALSERELRSAYPETTLPVFTENTIGSADALVNELAVIRETGHALSEEELEASLYGIAVPIFDNNSGDVLSAMSVSYAGQKPDDVHSIVSMLKECARLISGRL